MNREVHARFYEGRGVKFPPATHQQHVQALGAMPRNGRWQESYLYVDEPEGAPAAT